MTSIAVRLSTTEIDYLTELAKNNKIYKGQTEEISLGKTLKALIHWCQTNNVTTLSSKNSMNENVLKMIEQIHISIPHLMYLSRLQTLIGCDEFPDEKIKKYRFQTLDYINKICGDFQNIPYNEIRFSINDIGLKTIPTDKDKTQWILP